MSTPVRAPATPTRVVLLLAMAVCINYVDRGNLATAAPLIQDELKLSATQLGMLLSAFFWTYVAAMTPAGWLAERFGARRVLAGGVAIWSVATLLTGLAGSLATLLLLRLMLGLGESTAFPSSSKAMAAEVPRAAAWAGQWRIQLRLPRRTGAGHGGGRPADGKIRLAAGIRAVRLPVAAVAVALAAPARTART